MLQSASDITFHGVFLGGVVAGYLVKRHGGTGIAAGMRAGLIGGIPALWSLKGLLVGILLLALPILVGGLAGRFGGWLAERQGHPRVPATGS